MDSDKFLSDDGASVVSGREAWCISHLFLVQRGLNYNVDLLPE